MSARTQSLNSVLLPRRHKLRFTNAAIELKSVLEAPIPVRTGVEGLDADHNQCRYWQKPAVPGR